MRTAPMALAFVLAAAQWGCTDDTAQVAGYVTPTTISVDPQYFLGDVPCSPREGAMRSFVATITDRTTGFVLASSPPVPCTAVAGFQFVVLDHEYTAEVDGYEEPADTLVPVGGRYSGSRTMVLADATDVTAPDARVTPRWTTSCGEGATGSAVAKVNTVVPVRGCTPLEDTGAMGETRIAVDVHRAVGDLGCTADGGAVEVVAVSGPGLPDVLAACDGAPVVFTAGLVAGQFYELRVEGRPPESDPGVEPPLPWAARCYAVAEDGVEVLAVCDEMTDAGAIELDVGALLTADALACGVDVSSYRARLESDDASDPLEIDTGDVDCDVPVHIAPVRAGTYGGTLEISDSEGEILLKAACGAFVEPARVTTALCTVLP